MGGKKGYATHKGMKEKGGKKWRSREGGGGTIQKEGGRRQGEGVWTSLTSTVRTAEVLMV